MSGKRLCLFVTVALLTLWSGRLRSAAVRAQGSKESDRRPLVLDRAPIRAIQDPHPSMPHYSTTLHRL